MIETNTIVGTGMKVVTQRDELAQKLGVVARAVSTRASVQILSGVLLTAEGGRLHLAATDMELSLRSSLDAQVDGEGSVVVPGRLLVDLVRLLPDNEVTIEHRAEESVVHVTSGPSTSTLHTYAADDFPRLPDLDAVGTFTVDRESLLDTVSRVARSASRDESRPVLTGILVRFEAGKLVMAATDSYRLSVSFTDSRYESVAAMTSLPASKRTRIPVNTGRDSSRDAERATRETVSSSDSRSTVNVPTASRSGSRGKSSAAYVWSVDVDEPDVMRTTLSSARCSIVTSLSGSNRTRSTSSRPGTTTEPSPSTCASSEDRSESSMSVAAR